MKTLFFALLTILALSLPGQSDITLDKTAPATTTLDAPSFNGTPITFTGTVLESNSDLEIDFATVALYDKTTDELITGADTEDGGQFTLTSTTDNVYLVVSFIGYASSRTEDFNLNGSIASFGIIHLSEEAEMLVDVEVIATRSTVEFKTDKRVFNVGSDLTSSGASALEVLNNVPSVNVDIEGAVTLRGSGGVQILLNGKPSVLADEESGALGNITADMIDKVEVITNPSAKYDAEGTSGIINIVLKKNNSEAFNGSVTVNTGIPANHSVGLSLNKRTEKFNLFTQLGVGYKAREYDATTINTNLLTGSVLSSFGTESRNESYYNLVLGSDYYINPKNVITLSGSYTFEQEDQPSLTTFDLSSPEGLSNQWTRFEETTASNPKLQYDLKYTREFDDHKDHKLAFSAIGNYFSKDQSSSFTESLINGQVDLTDQLTNTRFEEGKYTFNIDYTKPFSDKVTFETGAQYVDNIVSNDYSVQDLIDDTFVLNTDLTNVFEYNQKVLGTYATGAYEGSKWGVKLGARLEYTDISTLLLNTGEDNSQTFLDLFPSAHTSYKVSDRVSLQAGYSRRIYRPRLWDLNPFFNIRNNFSIRTGNPSLNPEYTDSYEIGSIFIYDNITFNVNAYRRLTTDKIEYISTFTENATVFSPLNIGIADTKGLEVNFKYTPTKKITLTGDLNYNYFTRTGIFNEQDFNFSNDQWNTKLTTKYKVNRKLDVEATGRYNSAVQTVQGIQSDNLYMDLGARYKLQGGKYVLNLSVRDVFSSRQRESFTFDDTFENYSLRDLGRFVSFGVSYGFGKGEAMTYSGAGRRR